MRQNIGIEQELELEPELREALGNFRQNVDAWSEQLAARPRTVEVGVRRLSWRLALSVALGGLAVVGSLVVYRHGLPQANQQVAVANPSVTPNQRMVPLQETSPLNAQAEAAERDLMAAQAMLASQQSTDEMAELRVSSYEQLLAAVDTDLKRQVPSVMEPLAQLAEDGSTE